MLARVAFYPTLVYNVLMEKLTSRQWYNRIDDTVVLGALPFKSMTKQLVSDEGVAAVVTMNEDYETKFLCNTRQEWEAVGVEQLRLSTVDLVASPTQENLQFGVGFLLKFHKQGKSVYVHCKAGRTRSATLVACYLMQIHQWNPEEAISFLRELRPHIIIRTAQLHALLLFYKNNVQKLS